MSKKTLRHTSLSSKPEVAARQMAENARDANELFATKVDGYLVTVPRYAAIGSASAKIKLEAVGFMRPRAVVTVRIRKTADPGSVLTGVSPGLNFYHDTTGVGIYEPDGLTADEKYDLTFLVLE